MATLTIRNLPDDVVARLKAVARVRGRSMEQEVRSLLESRYAPRKAALSRIRARWPDLPPTSAEEVETWIEEGRS